MTIEFDRYAIERTIQSYSNDLLSASYAPILVDEETRRNAIDRAQSLLSDWDYLEVVVQNLRDQLRGMK